MKATKIIQVVLVIFALALIGGAAAGLLGVFDDDGGSSSGGGGGSGGGSSNTETTAPDDTAVRGKNCLPLYCSPLVRSVSRGSSASSVRSDKPKRIVRFANI